MEDGESNCDFEGKSVDNVDQRSRVCKWIESQPLKDSYFESVPPFENESC